MSAPEPDVDTDEDYFETGLFSFIGPVRLDPAWGMDTDEPPPLTDAQESACMEFLRRRDWAAAELRSIEREREREDRMASLRADRDIAAAARAGDLAGVVKLTGRTSWMPPPDNDNKPAGKSKLPLHATPFVLRDPKSLAPRDWLYAKHYARKYLTATFGAGGSGKSGHSNTEILAMVTGRPLLGEAVRERIRVWSINLEDDIDEIERRLGGACLHFGITAGEIGDRLFTDSGRDQEFVVARTKGRDITVVEPVVQAMIREIKERKIDLLVVDPFVSTHSVPENDNGAIQTVAEQWVRIAHECNCAVELVHHIRKGNGLEATADDGRGAGSLKDKCRSVRVVNPMTKDEADKAGIPASDLGRYFRVDLSKFNNTAGSNSKWRRFASIQLGNKPSFYEEGDEIGVVEPWRWPSPADIVGDVSAAELKGILGRLQGGDARESEQSPNWAGYVVSELLGIDTSEKAGKTRVRALLGAWIKSGVLIVEEDLDQKRQTRKFIRVGAAPPPTDSGGAEVGQGAADSNPDTCPTPPPPFRGGGGGAEENGEIQGGAVGGANRQDFADLNSDDDDDAPLTDDQIPGFLKKSRSPADPSLQETA